MKPINPKRFVASAVIFLFTNFSSPAMANVDALPISLPTTTQESVVAAEAPQVNLATPRIVYYQDSSQTQAKATIQSIDYAYTILADLKRLPFNYGHDKVNVVHGHYGAITGGYVCMAGTNLETGYVNINQANNPLEKNLMDLLAAPHTYKLNSDFVNAQFSPKIVSDSVTGFRLLLMEAWDFRLVRDVTYSDVSIHQMMTQAYSTFKAYAQIMRSKQPDMPIVLHTSYWGSNYRNNARVTTAIQLLAAHLAGIDTVLFHANIRGGDMQALADAQGFLLQQDGKNVGDILTSLLQLSTSPSWSAGTCMTAAFGDSSETTMAAN